MRVTNNIYQKQIKYHIFNAVTNSELTELTPVFTILPAFPTSAKKVNTSFKNVWRTWGPALPALLADLMIFCHLGPIGPTIFKNSGMLRSKNLTRWPWKSIAFQTLLRTKYLPSLVKIHWRMLIEVFTAMLHGTNVTPWPLTLKINRIPDSSKDYVCTMFGQNPLKDVDSRVFRRMLRGTN